MLNVTGRDGAGRLATWETDQGELALPTVAHVHTLRRQAPPFARLALSEDQHPELATVLVRGTRFSVPEEGGEDVTGDLVVPRGLVYPSIAGGKLQQAADEINREGAKRVQLVHRPTSLEGATGLVVLPSARDVAEDPWRLPGLLVQARERAGPNGVLFTPGIGSPDQAALALYCGVDILDGLVPVLEARRGRYLTPEASLPVADLAAPTCGCPACQQAEASEDGFTQDLLARHNQWTLEAEVRRARQALQDGSLRELVEQRVHARPELLAMLRRLDHEHAAFFESRAPALRERQLPIVSRESLDRPEIARWVHRLEERYTPPPAAKVLVVLPCSATKPYENSPTHQRIRPVINRHAKGRSHVATLTSPLGAVPEELERFYPAAHYDIPVTGSWFEEERRLVRRAFQALADTGAYDSVLFHLPPEEAALIEEVFPQAVHTVPEGARPTDREALDALEQAVIEAARPYEAVARQDLFGQHMDSRCDWQFGRGVHTTLLEEVEVHGKYPWLKIDAADGQRVAMLHPERGCLVLATEGGRRLARATKDYLVEIDDFHPKGTIFAVGVRWASKAIRVEDEVAVVHEGEFRGAARAVAPGPLMAAMEAGPAVEVRHHA